MTSIDPDSCTNSPITTSKPLGVVVAQNLLERNWLKWFGTSQPIFLSTPAVSAGPKSPAQRAMHRADRIADRLHDKWKGTTKRKWEFRPKPSWMPWETYQRLKRQSAGPPTTATPRCSAEGASPVPRTDLCTCSKVSALASAPTSRDPIQATSPPLVSIQQAGAASGVFMGHCAPATRKHCGPQSLS